MKKIFKAIIAVPKYLALGVVAIFKFCISPIIPHACKFTPTCSIYASQSFAEWGFFVGGWLAFKRILRCHPKAKEKTDPVPINIKKRYKYFM